MTELLFGEAEAFGCTSKQRAIIEAAWSKARIRGDKIGNSGRAASSYTYTVSEVNMLLRANHFTHFSGGEQVVIEISKSHRVLFRVHIFRSNTTEGFNVTVKKDQTTSEVLRFLEMQ